MSVQSIDSPPNARRLAAFLGSFVGRRHRRPSEPLALLGRFDPDVGLVGRSAGVQPRLADTAGAAFLMWQQKDRLERIPFTAIGGRRAGPARRRTPGHRAARHDLHGRAICLCHHSLRVDPVLYGWAAFG